ncbi:hypothetical protein [uncultured phage cr108_1]|uniref:Uncharacterized protein n=1 Tax=uncultured phage cr108_1 TaxID=2772069 RepID=A0A7M1RX21_9CAUD|nr:hypothetical protein KNV36_gp055 [uncultured phage cr108_1]QOR58985.1 hypothetical protein [uncultured phage cr108_1]DAU77630.1 MAG TPA: hypothetical protein [Crassvirales sp.]
MAISMYDRLEYGDFKLPSLQEMMIAPQYLTQEHEKMEDAFMQNQALAADAATRFQPGVDDAAIQANQQFQSSVEADINDLSKNGLTPGIRRRLLQRKSDFTNNILPLNKAAVDREQWAKVAREAQLRNPSLIIRDPMTVGLDRWIADPASRELNPVSGQEIYERTRQEMIPISKYISDNLPQLTKTGLPYKYWAMTQAGATPKDIALALNKEQGIDLAKAAPLAQLIRDAANKVITSTGVYDYYGANSNEAQRAWEYAASAFNTALGAAKVDGISDDFSMRMALEQAKERALAKRAAGKGKNTNLSGLYFADKYGAAIDVPQIKELQDLREAIANPSSSGFFNRIGNLYSPTVGAGAASSYQGSNLSSPVVMDKTLKKFGIDPAKYTTKEAQLKAIDNEIDKLGKKYGYTTYDDPDLKKGFINRVIPAITTGSLQVFGSLENALEGTNALQDSKWFGKDAGDLITKLNNKDSNSFSIEPLDNFGVVRIRDGKDTFFIRPEDIDQSEIGYYNALRKVRAMSDEEYNTVYNQTYNDILEAESRGDVQSYMQYINYLEFLSELRDSTIPSRTKTAAITTGENKAIQFEFK